MCGPVAMFNNRRKTTDKRRPRGWWMTIGRLRRSRDGAAAIEFAMLAIPYCMIVFAILETCIAFLGDQLVGMAVDTMARKIRTGQITTAVSEEQFRQEFCDEISILITCSPEEIKTPAKLYLDVRSFPDFESIPKGVPRVSSERFADLDPSSFGYTPGGPQTINMVRAYYRWDIVTDLVRPYISTARPADGSMSTFLIVQSAAFATEQAVTP